MSRNPLQMQNFQCAFNAARWAPKRALARARLRCRALGVERDFTTCWQRLAGDREAYAALEGFELQRQAARQIFDDLLADVALAARWALSAFRVAAMDVPAEPERLSLKRDN
jgi:hypothetical protein